MPKHVPLVTYSQWCSTYPQSILRAIRSTLPHKLDTSARSFISPQAMTPSAAPNHDALVLILRQREVIDPVDCGRILSQAASSDGCEFGVLTFSSHGS